ncbi:hypothetical protein E2C01_070382 [Portunus trituberculatus]|uniref:Uncharacterized protein n=1 Tax=Portunus trituberculatus TaxID=210409 RepID=A0A5B7HX56_PORTR|nr:hypothetical protein [Portunus trituberculatus]
MRGRTRTHQHRTPEVLKFILQVGLCCVSVALLQVQSLTQDGDCPWVTTNVRKRGFTESASPFYYYYYSSWLLVLSD